MRAARTAGVLTRTSRPRCVPDDQYGRTPEELQRLGPRYQLEITTVLHDPASHHVLGCNNKLDMEWEERKHQRGTRLSITQAFTPAFPTP